MLHDFLDSSITFSNAVIKEVDYTHRVVMCKFVYIQGAHFFTSATTGARNIAIGCIQAI
jgi:hypothetical protein